MSKTEQQTPAKTIEAGKPIKLTAATREELSAQLAELRKNGEAEGLTPIGGFILYMNEEFSSTITFVKP
jgi:hypothetical protein